MPTHTPRLFKAASVPRMTTLQRLDFKPSTTQGLMTNDTGGRLLTIHSNFITCMALAIIRSIVNSMALSISSISRSNLIRHLHILCRRRRILTKTMQHKREW
jgi:hypothetical protein